MADDFSSSCGHDVYLIEVLWFGPSQFSDPGLLVFRQYFFNISFVHIYLIIYHFKKNEFVI